MRKQLSEISKKADAAFSECTSGATGDRERLQRETAHLNAAVHALQQLREDAATSMEVQRTVLQDSRETRDRERERFQQGLSEERMRLAHERATVWAEVDRAHAAVLESQQKISDLEARAAAVVRDTTRLRYEKQRLEEHIARTRGEQERHSSPLHTETCVDSYMPIMHEVLLAGKFMKWSRTERNWRRTALCWLLMPSHCTPALRNCAL